MANPARNVVTRELNQPTGSRSKKIRGTLMEARFPLVTAANGTMTEVAGHTGDLQAIILHSGVVGAGMTYDVQVNGVTVLAAPFIHTAAFPANTEISIPFLPNKRIRGGDTVSVVRSAFAAGASVVQVRWA